MTSNDPNVQAVLSRGYWHVYQSRQYGQFWRVEVRSGDCEGVRIAEHAATLEEACAAVVARLREFSNVE